MCKGKNPISFYRYLFITILLLFSQGIDAQLNNFNLNEASNSLPHILGKPQNAAYLYATAGNRLYCIGNQAGAFPETGFHIPGKMGGIWQQPLKLMDGFRLKIKEVQKGNSYDLISESFKTYSFANQFNYRITDESLRIVQIQFVPDDLPVLVVEYSIRNTSSRDRDLDLEFLTDIDLMPVWLGEGSGMHDSTDIFDSFDSSRSLLFFKDKGNSWYAGIGFDDKQVQFSSVQVSPYKGKGITGMVTRHCYLAAGQSKNFRLYISGSMNNTSEIAKNIAETRDHLSQLFQLKKDRYQSIEKTAEIKVPDTLLQSAYNWGKYATDWLRRDVPSLGKGMSAGLPDYPWFFSNDQAHTFRALTGTVDPQLFYDAFSMLKRISDKANDSSGRIIHEVSTNGVVYDKGRMEESQLHIISAWQIFNWTGNWSFLKENYAYAKKIWKWLQQHDSNHNGYIEGYGGVEIEGLNDEMLDVQVNTYRFLDILSKMAILCKEPMASKVYGEKAKQLKQNIDRDWWIESESRYADFITSKEKAVSQIDSALKHRVQPGRNSWALTKLNNLKTAILNKTYHNKGYVVYYNASGLQPMEEGMTDTARAMKMLAAAFFFTNKFGAYIAGIERPDQITDDERSFQKDSVFSYNRAVMPGATAGLALAAVKYGMPDTALQYIHKILSTFSYATPGTTYEVSPDYGMFVQAWNVSGINVPLIQYFFGIQPQAYKKEITIQLQMPHAWEEASLKNLIIGNNKLSVLYNKKNDSVTCRIASTEPGWKIHFVTDKKNKTLIVNNKKIYSKNGVFELTCTTITLGYKLHNK